MPEKEGHSIRIYLIGAGVPTPTPTRFGTCQVVQVGDDHLMFDCGPAATHKAVKAGLDPARIQRLFFTHHHYDHNADYPCFMLSRWNAGTGDQPPLQVWGPPRTEWITDRLIGPDGAFSDDWRARTQDPSSVKWYAGRGGRLPRPAPVVQARDIGPGVVAETVEWRVTAASARHQEPLLQSLAYRVDSGGHSLVIAGDTEPCETVGSLASGADMLVVTCWDHQEAMDQGGFGSVMGTVQAGRFARSCGVKRLVLTHVTRQLERPGSRERAIADVSRVFSGEIVFADEGMCLEV